MMTFATVAVVLYVGHHVGDYWVQTDHQAQHKGLCGWAGWIACTKHVVTYTLTQAGLLLFSAGVLREKVDVLRLLLGLLLSAVTHYVADRREYGLMFSLARLLPGKEKFLRLGSPRGGHYDDNPSLGTGAWALDQSWHIFWGVFAAALVIAA